MRGLPGLEPKTPMPRAPPPTQATQAPVAAPPAPAQITEEQAALNRFETDFNALYKAIDAAVGEVEFDATMLADKFPHAYQQLQVARANVVAAKTSMEAAWELITAQPP